MLPVQITLKACDGHLLLSSYKIELSEVGLEQGNPLEMYYAAAGIWGSVMWDMPIQVDGRQPYLLRYARVVQMLSLNKHLPGF